MSYYLAPSLNKLRAQINQKWPNRTKTSDGWIGDTSHQARPSDHNPDYTSGGVVRAIDIDSRGVNASTIIKAAMKDSRTNYIIHKGIIRGATQFKKRKYTGSNPHTHHIHISIKPFKSAESGHNWKLKTVSLPTKPKPSTKSWPNKPLKVTSKHTRESDRAWHMLMNAIGYRNKSLTTNIQRWLKALRDPRTGHGYYRGIIEADHGKKPVFGPMLIKALQRKLYDTKDASGSRLYNGYSDGKRQALTIKGEIRYLNLPANRGV